MFGLRTGDGRRRSRVWLVAASMILSGLMGTDTFADATAVNTVSSNAVPANAASTDAKTAVPGTTSSQKNTSSANPPAKALNEDIQDIKKQALELNRDLFNLEEELLFPANTQVAVFVSMDVGEFFQLDAVQIKLDDKIVANYLYTERQVDALHRGGVQRLYVGNVKGGKHEIVAVLTGRGPHDRDYRRGATFVFDKADQAKFVELKIVDSLANYQPEFQIKEWQ